MNIDTYKKDFNGLELTDNYRSKSSKKKFNTHLDDLVNTAIVLNNNEKFVLKDPSFQLDIHAYWEIESYILEKTDTSTDQDETILDNLEDYLRDTFKKSLGQYYDNSPELADVMNFSTDQTILSCRFDNIKDNYKYKNPWESCKSIIYQNALLFNFHTDLDYLMSFGKSQINPKESKEIANQRLGLVTKGRRKKFNTILFRDIFGLRNTVLNHITEKAPDSSQPITKKDLINILRKQGISELEISNNQVYSWLIRPLKSQGSIGSNKGGYFRINTCNDLLQTYNSHLENFKGYLRTLETYNALATRKGCNSSDFEQHLNLFK